MLSKKDKWQTQQQLMAFYWQGDIACFHPLGEPTHLPLSYHFCSLSTNDITVQIKVKVSLHHMMSAVRKGLTTS